MGWAGEGRGRERTPARQAALCGAAGVQPSKPPCVGGTGASPPPRWGAIAEAVMVARLPVPLLG